MLGELRQTKHPPLPPTACALTLKLTPSRNHSGFPASNEVMMASAADLLPRAQRFEEEALVEIYDRYSTELYRYAMRLLGDADLAEECVAETFSRLLHAFKEGKGPRQYLRAYLYRVAHNWVSDLYRRGPAPSLPLEADLHAGPDENPSKTIQEASERERVRAALARLTADQRQVIVLRYLEGWGHGEIAKALNKNEGAVRALQHRGLNALRRLLIPESEVFS